MRILLITYYYPPDPAVGALRAAKVAEAFRAAGHDVVVLTSRSSEGEPRVRIMPSGVEIRAVRPFRHPRELYLAAKAWLRRSRAGGSERGGVPEEAFAPPRRVPAWKRYLFSLLYLPDSHQGFIPAALLEARRVLRGGVDLIYTTVPPFSVHLVGLWLKRVTGRCWAAEFRDPWTDNPTKRWYQRSALSARAERWLERRCLELADHVVCVSEGIGEALLPKVPAAERSKLVVVRNGIDRLAPPTRRARAPGGPFTIVHVGSFYHGRDPRPFLAGLATFLQRGGADRAGVAVEFVGHCRWFGGVSIEREVERLGLADVVRLRDWVPHEVSRSLVEQADMLLLLAQEQPTQVPNKLYEYLGTRAPILAFADRGGETARMLHQVGGHYLIYAPEPAQVEVALEDALRSGGHRASGRPDQQVLEEWTTGSQMRMLVETITKRPAGQAAAAEASL